MKVVIVGGGQVGTYITRLLLDNKCLVRMIEKRENVVEKLKSDIPSENIVYGSGTDPAVLEAAGIVGADVVAAVTGEDETNLVASTIAKFEFNVPRVIARVNNPKNTWLFNHGMGVDVALNPADLVAHLVVEEIDLKNIMTLLKVNRGNYSIGQIVVDSSSTAVNKSVNELAIPINSVLIAITRGQNVITINGNTVINSGDNILVFADEDAQTKINKLFGSSL